jgi:hypothetical protein
VGAPRGSGDRADPHHGVGGCRGSAVWPGDGGPRWRPEFLDGQCLDHGEWELGAGLDAVERWGALGRFI